MSCYVHREIASVGICKSCGKAVCPECAAAEAPALACATEQCADRVAQVRWSARSDSECRGRPRPDRADLCRYTQTLL